MTETVFQLLIIVSSFVLPFLFLLGAFVIGGWQERRHFERLAIAEHELQGILVTDIRRLPQNWQVKQGALVCGEVVVANDKFKMWLSKWINIFGGRVAPFETLIERARREALVRMQQEAVRLGCNAVWNVRLETMAVRTGQDKTAGVEVLAYGTALKVDQGQGM